MLDPISSFFESLTPELALAGGVRFHEDRQSGKQDLILAKGGNFFSNLFGGGNKNNNATVSAPPTPPKINLPPIPVPPPPPPPPTASSQDVSQAAYDAQKAMQNRFGFRSSLLQPQANPATGSKSLLGN
jgi:hypothetical protein